MMRFFCYVLLCISAILTTSQANAQTLKVGVFDLDLMVQALPGYRTVDSLVQEYEADSLPRELQFLEKDYQRLDSTYKADSAFLGASAKTSGLLDKVAEDRRRVALNIVYWQQISQNKSNNKRGTLAQPLYEVVTNAYKRVLARKKYTLILKPQTYEAGFPIDNIFISMARELKLQSLPQELLYLGDDPDPAKQPAKAPTGAKPKTN
ncbi:MAG: hypothetical protein H7Y42_11080 [Chitinophagaceae bacterium]|nr:hypothetical protein [Chitinophagaceae bacterium]